MSNHNYFLHNGVEIVNTIMLEESDLESYISPEGWSVIPAVDTVGIGYKLVNDVWTAPDSFKESVVIQTEDADIIEAKNTALNELTALGISEPVARTIVGLPPSTTV